MITAPEPWGPLRRWWSEARAHPHIRYAHAATLATVDPRKRADARVVLVHHLEPPLLVFSTDEASPKARQLAGNREAALLLYWGPLDRQVRLRGPVELADSFSDSCFEERPAGSRITAWASRQGMPSESGDAGPDRAGPGGPDPGGAVRELSPGDEGRRLLEAAWAEVGERLGGADPIPRPPWWRAYALRPREIELWQARRRRLHDRILYRRSAAGWAVSRLWP